MVEQWDGVPPIENDEQIGHSEDQLNLNVSCVPKRHSKTTSHERYIFNTMFQMKGETLDHFFSKIQSQSKKCEFGDSCDRLLIYKIIVGIRNDMVRRELMSDADHLSLEHTIEKSRMSEQTWKKLSLKRRYPNADWTAPSVSHFDGNVPELQYINDDSLRHIFRYLNLMDVINLSKTCKRFGRFAHTDFFPQNSKRIIIKIAARIILLQAPLLNKFISEVSLNSMEDSFSYFDCRVEDLTFILNYVPTTNEQAIVWRSSITMMSRCKNLKALHYNSWLMTHDQADELQDQIEKFEFLKELDISRCFGITSIWRAPFRGFSKIEKLSFSATDVISTHFLDYFRNLSTLTIDFGQCIACDSEDLTRMLVNNEHCLQNLTLHRLSELKNYSSIGRMITARLSKLKSLGLEFYLKENSRYMIELAHLNSLTISCSHYSVNSVLRTLSNNGFIEELQIYDGVFVDEDDRALPFIFNKLRSLIMHQVCRVPSFWSQMTESQMPALKYFEISLRESSDLNDMVRFFKSKKTINSIRLSHKRMFDDVRPLQFFDQLIQILKEPCTPQRPFLSLHITEFRLDVKEVQLLHPNRHLLCVTEQMR